MSAYSNGQIITFKKKVTVTKDGNPLKPIGVESDKEILILNADPGRITGSSPIVTVLDGKKTFVGVLQPA